MILLLATLQAVAMNQFPFIEHPGAPGLTGHVREVCGARAFAARTRLLAEEEKAAQPIIWHRENAATWDSTACARLRLAVDGAPAHDGPGMVSGTSWLGGAAQASREALRLAPTNTRAIETLAVSTLADPFPDSLTGNVRVFVAAAARGVRDAAILRACSEFALRTGRPVDAERCATLGLATGQDSTWHLIRLASVSAAAADTAGAQNHFFAAAAAAHDSLSRLELAWHLQWFMSPAEQQQFAVLPDSEVGSWVQRLLAVRDIRDGRPSGARFLEHLQRLAYATAHFAAHRPAMFAHSGPVGATPVNRFEYQSTLASCEPAMIPAPPFRDYISWQAGLDDRGVVWMRFGTPDKRVIENHVTCPDTTVRDLDHMMPVNQREAWSYTVDGRTLLLNFESEKFSGVAAATRLVSGVLGTYLCEVDSTRCALTENSKAQYNVEAAVATLARLTGTAVPAPRGSPRVTRDEVERLRQDDLASIRSATTADDNSTRTEKHIDLAAQFARVWDPLTGQPRAVVSYAVPVRDLAVEADDGQRTARFHVAVRQGLAAGERLDTTIDRRVILPDSSMPRPVLTGFVVLPTSPTMTAWSVVANQGTTRSGRRFDVDTPPLDSGSVALSDPIVGDTRQGLVWSLHNLAIPLAPAGVTKRTDTLTLYYQVRSTHARDDLRVRVVFYGENDTNPVLQFGYPPQHVNAGVNEYLPSVEVSRLGTGTFRVELRITDGNGVVLSRRSVPLVLE